MNEFRDKDLVERFRALRAREHASAPAFSRLVPGRARRPGRAIAWTLATAAAAITVWLVNRPQHPEPLPPVMPAWTAPTDGLLQTPGRTLLRELPRLNSSILDALIEPEPITKSRTGDAP